MENPVAIRDGAPVLVSYFYEVDTLRLLNAPEVRRVAHLPAEADE